MKMIGKKLGVFLAANIIIALFMTHPIASEQNITEINYHCDLSSPGFNRSICPLFRCIEMWSCTDWSSCSDGMQTRECFETSNCNTTDYKPQTTDECLAQQDNINPDNGKTDGGNSERQEAEGTKEGISLARTALYAGAAIAVVAAGVLIFFAYRKLSEKIAYAKIISHKPSKTLSETTEKGTPESQAEQTQQAAAQSTTNGQSTTPLTDEQTQQYGQPQAQKSDQPQAQNNELYAYIQQSLSEGYTKEQIKATLLESGWTEQQVDEALSSF